MHLKLILQQEISSPPVIIAVIITLISEIWQDVDPALIARSFDPCGITSKNLTDFDSQLRHLVRTNQVEYVVPIDLAISANNCGLDD